MPKAATASMGICGRTTTQRSEDVECVTSGSTKAAAARIAQIALVKTIIHGRISDPSVDPHRAAVRSRPPPSRGDMLRDHARNLASCCGSRLRILARIETLFSPENLPTSAGAGGGQLTWLRAADIQVSFVRLTSCGRARSLSENFIGCRSRQARGRPAPYGRTGVVTTPVPAPGEDQPVSHGPGPIASGQPGSINVPIRSAGQTRLTGALVSASKDGSLPSGRSTMWWLKWASTPARYRPVAHLQICWCWLGRGGFGAAKEKTRRPNLGNPGGPIMIFTRTLAVLRLTIRECPPALPFQQLETAAPRGVAAF
jgi:hypothetical protein